MASQKEYENQGRLTWLLDEVMDDVDKLMHIHGALRAGPGACGRWRSE